MKAYFTTMRAATQIMLRQGTGGSIVVVGSKNAVAVGSNAAVYSAAKAFELHPPLDAHVSLTAMSFQASFH